MSDLLNEYRIWSQDLGEEEQGGLVLQALSPKIALKGWVDNFFESEDEDDSLLVKVRDLKTNESTEWIIYKNRKVLYDIRLCVKNTVTA